MRLFHGTVLTVAMLTVGCASGGASAGANEQGPEPEAFSDNFSQDVGLATMSDLRRFTNRILERFQYEIERFDEGAYTFIDTRWRNRPVT